MSETPATSAIGRSVPRIEDRRLLTGAGHFVEDMNPPAALGAPLHAAVVRSPVARARIAGIDLAEAKAVAGVAALYTGADLDRLGLAPLPCLTPVENADGSPFHAPHRLRRGGKRGGGGRGRGSRDGRL
jgi:carbon-monoxide dehydrogenase large subunit